MRKASLFVALYVVSLCNAQAPSPAPTRSPTIKPTHFPTPILSDIPDSKMGSVKQAFYEGLFIACGAALIGLVLGFANLRHDRERAEKKLNKVANKILTLIHIY